MYYKIASHCVSNAYIRGEEIFIKLPDQAGKEVVYSFLMDGSIAKKIIVKNQEYARRVRLYDDFWLIDYNDGSPLENTLNIFSIDGQLRASIAPVSTFPEVVSIGNNEVYLCSDELFKYNQLSHQCESLGISPLPKFSYYELCHRGLHIFTGSFCTQLVAIRDKGGQGLEIEYCLDFSDSDRWNGITGSDPEPGKINFINCYENDLWITTQERLHRIDLCCGKTIEVQNDTLPKMFQEGHLGYSLFLSHFTIMDFQEGRVILDMQLDKFKLEGKEYRCEYKTLCIKDKLLYVSVRISSIYALAIFDISTQKFIWHDLWNAYPILRIDLIEDSLIAYAYREIRIYRRE